jgi:hypothetical protein
MGTVKHGPMGTVKANGKWYARWTCTLGHEHRKVADSHKAARHLYHAEKTKLAEAKRRGETCCPGLALAPRLVDELLDDFLAYSKATKRSHDHDLTRARRLRSLFGGQIASSVTPKAIEDMKHALAAEFSEANANRISSCSRPSTTGPGVTEGCPAIQSRQLRSTRSTTHGTVA